MSQVAIVTDSLASLPDELVREYGIIVVPEGFILDGRPYRDMVDMTVEEFWTRFKTMKSFSTNASPPGEFVTAFQAAAGQSDTILCIVVSKALSGTYQSALQARYIMNAEYPQLKIEVLDGKSSAGALGLVVLEAARAARAGKGLSEIIGIAQDMIGKVKSVCGMETLKYLIRSGRSPLKVYTQELRGIHPLIGMVGGNGLVDNLGTIKGKQQCFDRLVEMIGEYADAGKPLHVIVQYTTRAEDGKKLMRMISRKYNCAEMYLSTYSQNSSGHSGPVNSISFWS